MKPLHRILALARGRVAVAAGTENQARLHKAVCSSVTRMLHRLGMSGRAEIRPLGGTGQPPALFITVERAVVKLSQATMSMLSREAIAHAQRKYATEIEGVYWRIEVDFDRQDDLEGEGDAFGPTTLGYLVEEASVLDSDLAALGKMISEAEAKLVAAENAVHPVPETGQVNSMARQVRDSIDRRRHERGLVDT
ncbi:MAG: hypothetical protein KKG92_05495 [Gammaproteobacteria bacterium]|nr:hypothetical protein [Gammaproteobacteria bacterium]